MNANSKLDRPGGDAISEAGGWLTMLGMLTMVLFPFAMPAIVLTLVALAPLLLLGVVGGLLALLLAPPVLLARGVRRRRRAPRTPSTGGGDVARSAA